MSGGHVKFVPGPTPKPEEPAEHPGGNCGCTKNQRRIVRVVMGYGQCGHCGKLTPGKVRVAG